MLDTTGGQAFRDLESVADIKREGKKMRNKSALLIAVAMIAVVSSGCMKNYSTSKNMEFQTMPPNIIRAVEEACDSMGYDVKHKNVNSIRCAYENSYLMQYLFMVHKQSDISITRMTEKSLEIYVSINADMGYSTQAKADELLSEFNIKLNEQLTPANK